jgi:uracil-DNA glycosylase
MKRNKSYWQKEIGISWTNELSKILRDPYMDKLMDFIQVQYAMNTIYPKQKENIFHTFKLTSWDNLKIVIINDLTDSCNLIPNNLLFGEQFIHPHPNESLMEIRKCLEREYDKILLDFDSSLESWGKQGILMLNQSLTFLENDYLNHVRPWNKFIQFVISHIAKNKPSVIFILWGNYGKSYSPKLVNSNHVFSCDTPTKKLSSSNDWKCSNFKDVNILLNSLTNEKELINWCDFIN